MGCTRGSRHTPKPPGRSSHCRRGRSRHSPAPAGTWGRTRAGTSPQFEVEPSQSRPRPGGAPVARAQAEIAAVPLPSSMASSREPNPSRRRSSDSGVPQSPQSNSSVCHAFRPAAMWAGAHRSQAALLRSMYSNSSSAGGSSNSGWIAVPVRAVVELAYLGWTGATSTRYRVRARHRGHTWRTRCRIWLAGRHPERFSERLLEPMSSSVTPLREGYALPRHREVVSPELALVDPELAASARATLPGPRARRRQERASSSGSGRRR